MSLREKQSEFARMVARLIDQAFESGLEVTLGDAYRDPRADFPYSSKSSRHKMRLAIDLNLFNIDGVYLNKTSDHAELGLWWEQMGGIWGGSFPSPDGNHYEWPL